MNQFKLDLSLHQAKYNEEFYVITSRLFVDDIELCDDYISLYDLFESLKQSGEFFIFNCSCGVPGCSKIENGVKVKHKGGKIKWKTRIPASYYGYKSFHYYLKTVKNKNFIFNKQDMIAQCNNELEKIKNQMTPEIYEQLDEFEDNTYFLLNYLNEQRQ